MSLVKCSKCGKFKHKSEFYKDLQKKSDHRPDCKLCTVPIRKRYIKNNREKINTSKIIWNTGINRTEYDFLYKESNGKCMICGKTELDNKKKLSIDHCHTSKVIRGLLCYHCNVGLGFFKDNKSLLEKAIKYLDKNLEYKNIIHKEKKE